MTGEELTYNFDSIGTNFKFITHLKTYIIGSLTLSILCATLFGFLGYVTLTVFNRKKITASNR